MDTPFLNHAPQDSQIMGCQFITNMIKFNVDYFHNVKLHSTNAHFTTITDQCNTFHMFHDYWGHLI